MKLSKTYRDFIHKNLKEFQIFNWISFCIRQKIGENTTNILNY